MTNAGSAAPAPGRSRWRFIGIESVLAMACRASEAIGMILAMLAVVWWLTPAQQGHFVSFLSMVGMIQFFDFGLSYAALQHSGYLITTGEQSRLAAFRALVLRIALLLGLAGMCIVAVAGYFIFGRGGGADAADWLAPWLVFTGLLAAAQVVMPIAAIHEGSVSVVGAWRMRLAQELSGALALLAGLAAGTGLWSLCWWAGMRFCVVAVWLMVTRGDRTVPWRLQNPASRRRDYTLADWRREIWAFQWKIGVSGLTAFAIFRSITLIVLATRGPVDAGRFGLSFAAMTVILGVTTVWPLSQAYRYGQFIGNNQMGALASAFRQMTISSTLFCASLALLCIAALYFADSQQWAVAARVADLETTALLVATAVVHHLIACWAVLLRAERRDPLLWVSIFGSVLLVVAIFVAATAGDLRDVALTNLLVSATGIPFAWLALRRFSVRHPGFRMAPAPGAST